MSIQRFRKRPVVVEALQWTGDNEAEIQDWIAGPGANGPGSRFFNALDEADRAGCGDPDATAQVYDKLHSTWVLVFTGQWVVRGVQGELYPIAESVLAETHEAADEPAGEDQGTALVARVSAAMKATREFRAGVAFGVPVDAHDQYADGLARAAVTALMAAETYEPVVP